MDWLAHNAHHVTITAIYSAIFYLGIVNFVAWRLRERRLATGVTTDMPRPFYYGLYLAMAVLICCLIFGQF